jgi:ribonuclease D
VPPYPHRAVPLATDSTDIAARAVAAGVLAIDTEFVSERRYETLLCLIQVSVPGPDGPAAPTIEVFDPLAHAELGPLAGALAESGVEVLMHAGRQDVGLLRRELGTEVTSLFDTQVAAGFLGLGSQVGYADLVSRVLGVRPQPSEGFTRWDQRPLSEQQVAYARGDVEHLPALGAELRARLIEAGRLEWALEECRPLEASTLERVEENVFLRLPGLDRMSGPARAIARELVSWREEAARAADRPAKSVLPDHVLVELSRRPPRAAKALENVRGLPEVTRHRRGRELLATIERGRGAEPPPPTPKASRPDVADAPVLGLAQALVRQRALENGVSAELVANQGDLARVVAAVRGHEAEPDVRPLAGWRRELVGRELLELLAGGGALRVGEAGVERV